MNNPDVYAVFGQVVPQHFALRSPRRAKRHTTREFLENPDAFLPPPPPPLPGACRSPDRGSDRGSDYSSASPSRQISSATSGSSPSEWSMASSSDPLRSSPSYQPSSPSSFKSWRSSGYKAVKVGDHDWASAERGGAVAEPWYRQGSLLRRGLAAGGILCMVVAALACVILAVEAARGSRGSASAVLLEASGLRPAMPRRLVGELYTFGAPGSSPSGLSDASRADGCIPGLRVYSHTERAGTVARRPVADPVSWITAQFNFSHPKMEALEVSDQNVRDNPIHPCNAGRLAPQSDDFWWMSGHLIYETVLKAHVDYFGWGAMQQREMRQPDGGSDQMSERLRKAHLMVHFSFMVYTPHVSKLVIDAPDWGWNLVGHATSESNPSKRKSFFSTPHRDHVTLYQHREGLQCILVFEGTNRDDQSDIISDLDISTQEFCGLGPVHDGFRDKLVQTLRSKDYVQVIKPKLSSCSDLALSGHSLGGAQAELFTACANSDLSPGDPGYQDFELIAWEQGSPNRLVPFEREQVPGSFLRNKGTGLCLDVDGTLNSHSSAKIGLAECEMPSTNYSKDQRWKLTPEGFLVSSLSGKCADVSGPNPSLGGSELRQWPCEFHIGENSVQRWEHTSEGFLKHLATGVCIDSKLATYPCPHTDQRWQMRADGHILNLMSNLCLDVKGLPPIGDGAEVILWDCTVNEETYQRWDLLPSGLIKNRRSGKCVRWESDNKMSLSLAPCDSEQVLSVNFAKDGFMRSQDSGLCVNVAGEPGTKPGTAVTLATCEDRHIETSGLWTIMPGGFIRNTGTDWDNQHMCLEIFGRPASDDKVLDGAPIHLDQCEVQTDQRWEVTDQGYLKSSNGGRKCVDLDIDGKLRLQNCVDWADPADYAPMKWQMSASGEVRNADSSQCITILDAGGGIGLQPCSPKGASGAQQWTLRPTGALVNRQTGQCVGLRIGVPQDGQPLQLQPCGSALREAQLPESLRWHLSAEGFLQSGAHVGEGEGLCLSQRSGGGSSLAMEACPTTGQRWELVDGGLLRNRLTGQCATAELNPAGMPSLSAKPCASGAALQEWEAVSVETPAPPPDSVVWPERDAESS